MKFLALLVLGSFLQLTPPDWKTDFAAATTEAKGSGKYLLLNFSGSDWCLPCIRMHKTIFETAAFESFASEKLVLVKADFPRLKKNQLPNDQVRRNETLAERYNREGKFPLTLLLDADGKVLRSWDGLPEGSAESFVNEIKAAMAAPVR